MANWGKIFLTTVLGAGVTGVIAYAARLRRTGTQLETVTVASVHSLKLDGLTVRVDVQLKNPTRSSLKIKFPFVKLIYDKKVIGSSKVMNKDLVIPAHGEAKVNAIMITMPVTGLVTLGGGFYNLLVKKQPVKLSVQTITTIDLGMAKVPFQKTDVSTLEHIK